MTKRAMNWTGPAVLLIAAAAWTGCSSDANLGSHSDESDGSGATANAGGTTSAASGGSDPAPSAGGSSGATGRTCEIAQCFRPIECVEFCGGPVVHSSCCPCEPGTFDQIECNGNGEASGGGAGTGNGEASGGAAGTGSVDLTDLNAACVDDTCPSDLTPISFFGMAGPSGPEYCWCSIPCEDDPSVCPEGTSCQHIAEGPGHICYVTE